MRKLAPLFSFELGTDRGEVSGCVAGVLRRVLCGNLRGRGCREGEESCDFAGERAEGEKERNKRLPSAADASPGIVARLMGLESMPMQACSAPETICRTRSANSSEAWNGLGEQRSGTQLRTSQSFREVPTYLRKENEDFLVLCFGIDDDGEPLELNASKKELLCNPKDTKESRGEPKIAEKRTSRNRSSCHEVAKNHNKCKARKSACLLSKEFSVSEKAMEPKEIADKSVSFRKKLSLVRGETTAECSSQNSSPVSVLDPALDSDGESLTSTDSFRAGTKVSIRNVEEDDPLQHVSLDGERLGVHHSTAKSMERGAFRSLEAEETKANKTVEIFARDFSGMWSYVCRLGAEHMNKTKWVTIGLVRCEEAEEIVAVVGKEILHHLLHEAVVEMLFS